MLSPRRSGRWHTGIWTLLTSVVGVMIVVALPPAAQAEGPEMCQVKVGDKLTWQVCSSIPGGGGGGNTGGGGNGGPTCTLLPNHEACIDGRSCELHVPANLGADYVTSVAGPPPADDYLPAYRRCDGDAAGVWYWASPEEQQPSTQDLALVAYGELPFPTFTPTFNPPARTVVNLETWWWAAGASDGELSAEAGGVTVTATPSQMTVETGDGAVLRCDFATTMSDECSHVYRKGNPAYQARMQLVWTVEFRQGGTLVDFPGLPATFESPWTGVTVPVTEIQTLVKPNKR